MIYVVEIGVGAPGFAAAHPGLRPHLGLHTFGASDLICHTPGPTPPIDDDDEEEEEDDDRGSGGGGNIDPDDDEGDFDDDDDEDETLWTAPRARLIAHGHR